MDDTQTGATTARIASWIARIGFGDLPAIVIERATDSILDTLGVTIAGAREPAATIARELLESEGARPAASQIGGTFSGSDRQVALLNGIAGHVLDYDDVSWHILGHPSVVILPAVLAVAEATKASGERAVTAYAVGVEVMAKVALALGPAHYGSGWHMTATAGTIGAAAAAASVLGLGAEQAGHALAIAASEAAGTRQNFGSMTKSFHVGHAASAGVLAARLARAGFTGDRAALEGDEGYFALLSRGPGDGAAMASLGDPYELASPGLSHKRFPACYGTHRGIQGVLDIVARDGVRAADVTAVRVSAPATELDPLVEGVPRTGLEGKFSMPYCVAAALLDGAVGLATFSDDMVRRPEAQRLLRLVTVQAQPGAVRVGAGEGRVDVTVTTRDGVRHETSVAHPPGSPLAPLSRADLVAKLRDCAGPVIGESGVRDLVSAAVGLSRAASVDALIASTRAAVPASS